MKEEQRILKVQFQHFPLNLTNSDKKKSCLGRLWQGSGWNRREASEIRGGFQTLDRLSLFLAGVVAVFWWDYGEGLAIRMHGQKYVQTLGLVGRLTLTEF